MQRDFLRERGPRVAEIMRSLAFYAVFYGTTVLLVFVAIGAMVLGGDRYKDVVRIWSTWHRTCARVFLGITVEAAAFVPQAGVLYAIKHESFFEAIELPHLYPYPVVFAKEQLLRIPLWGKIGTRYGLIAVDRARGASALRAMLTEARRWTADGRPLIIFPEGTRVRHGAQPSLQAGFAGLYKLLGLPVIPVAVDSGLLYQRRWKRAGTIRYRFGEVIPPGLPRDEIEARVHAAINALNARPPGA
ncbi:lysophospholipid acyltransferase family protein [Novosphingobium sp. PASSN1]|uniref:lysophospholipid acyltransferase family protein n=1 Tax=Novosphingobium sp. PASSN1 TaxID=2015561 RepID=UPI000BC638EC|nr:lysophospholipid acyltransferase family protein [Novosphingobium sp. PASSN1]OYU33889.1 MAG: 1-acyl-sn-glycerol-3-phosphate acyltransferase [Novosphingobium sp. PASSN1]